MTQNEANGYTKGYAAGRRRLTREANIALSEHRRDEFKRAVFVAILPELVARPWKTGEETWKGVPDFIAGAWKFANLAARDTNFSGELFDPESKP